jgi:hypothetical protein
MHHLLRRNAAMSTPNAGSDEPESGMSANVTTYVYDGYGEPISVSDSRGKLARVVEVEPKPQVEVAYDRSRHVIQTRKGTLVVFEELWGKWVAWLLGLGLHDLSA